MRPSAQEWQFDGLIGPTHNYAGLAYGNVASSSNAGFVSNPRQAALQGLEKMRFVQGLGLPQAFIPPHYRPLISKLEQTGFEGGTSQILERSYKEAPHLLAAVFSSSFMWAANAATVAPSCDTHDGRLHLTPANLVTNFHRSLEPASTHMLLSRIFCDPNHFSVHEPLESTTKLADEGAANHMRVCTRGHYNPGLHIFVYGADAKTQKQPSLYPARQQKEASEAVARLHQLKNSSTIFVQQNPLVIDAGVFHNDVICMNTTNLMIGHEKSFINQADFISTLSNLTGQKDGFQFIEISENELSLTDAVASYFFNSQLLELPDGRIVIVAPKECADNPQAQAALSRLASGNAISAVHYRDVRESMRNGGGPACLRLRVVMTEEEANSMHQAIVLTPEKYAALTAWVTRHYRDRLILEDLRDPSFITELNVAYEALEPIIGMKGFYTAQMR